MFYLIGIGLKPAHLTLEAIECIKKCGQVFLEDYTSEYSQGLARELNEIVGREIKQISRNDVEENFESALLSATANDIALLVFGNPLTATTHIQLLLDAKEKGIKYKVIPGISITNMIAESGLDEYKFGRTVTICFQLENFKPETFFDQMIENQKVGLHTLCLLDIKKDQRPQRLMNAKEGVEILEEIAGKRKLKKKYEYIALLAMASDKQRILVGKENIMNSKEIYELFPQCLIVPGKTNEKEKEALKMHERKK